MQRKRIAPDGSCLFASLDYLHKGIERCDCGTELRDVCVDAILNDPQTYTIDMLGEKDTVDEYCAWIRNPHTYGGGNEMSILAKHFNFTIRVVSCTQFEPCVILAQYSPLEEGGVKSVVYLLYNGQHYDGIVSDDGICRRSFEGDASDDAAAMELASQIKLEIERDRLTRIRKRLRCSCGVICEKAADWQHHVETIHAEQEDFDYGVEEIDVAEMVASVLDD